jgi:hypothetical protein
MELGHLLTRSGLTYPEVSSNVCHDSFYQLGNSVSYLVYYIMMDANMNMKFITLNDRTVKTAHTAITHMNVIVL